MRVQKLTSVFQAFTVRRALSVVLALNVALTFTGGIVNADPVQPAETASVPAVTQTLAVPASVQPEAIERDTYTAVQTDPVIWPFPASAISSGFGHREGCGPECSTDHKGVDFSVSSGSPIEAIANGTVISVETAVDGYGVHVVIAHTGRGVTAIYGHMLAGSPTVHAGEAVSAGQIIGRVGSTGASTGPHLHLEIHVGGTPVDPIGWLAARAG